MRRRRRGERTLSAEELVRHAESLLGHGSVGGTPLHDQWLSGLQEAGYDDLDYFRARWWLRRSKRPSGYRWEAIEQERQEAAQPGLTEDERRSLFGDPE